MGVAASGPHPLSGIEPRAPLLTFLEITPGWELGVIQTPYSSCAEPNSWLKRLKSTASESIKYGNLSLVRQAYFGTAVLAVQHDTSTALIKTPFFSCAKPYA